MIEAGKRLPRATVYELVEGRPVARDLAALAAGKRMILFGVPGAFTPTCSNEHLPGYVERAAELRAAGADFVACLSVNDPYVMAAWAEAHGGAGSIAMLADGNAEATKAMGLERDYAGSGMGVRCRRFAMLVDDGVVAKLEVEPARGVTVCGATHMLDLLHGS